MPTGFWQRNEYGTMLVDDVNPSLALRQKSSIGASGVTPYQLEIPNSEFPCMAFVASTPVWIRATTWNGTTRRFELLATVNAGNATVPITAYVFDRPIDSGLAAGFKLWDSQGRLTFDVYGKYGRVAHAFDDHGVFNGAAGRTYAVCILTSTRRDQLTRVNAQAVRVDSYRTGGRVSGSQVILEEILVSTITYQDTTAQPYNRVTGANPSGLVLDVTGY